IAGRRVLQHCDGRLRQLLGEVRDVLNEAERDLTAAWRYENVARGLDVLIQDHAEGEVSDRNFDACESALLDLQCSTHGGEQCGGVVARCLQRLQNGLTA